MRKRLTKLSRILECGAVDSKGAKCVNLIHFHYFIFDFGSFLPKRRISVNLVDLLKSFQTSIHYLLVVLKFYLVFTCNFWRQYSRERASQSLPKIGQKLGKNYIILEKT